MFLLRCTQGHTVGPRGRRRGSSEPRLCGQRSQPAPFVRGPARSYNINNEDGERARTTTPLQEALWRGPTALYETPATTSCRNDFPCYTAISLLSLSSSPFSFLCLVGRRRSPHRHVFATALPFPATRSAMLLRSHDSRFTSGPEKVLFSLRNLARTNPLMWRHTRARALRTCSSRLLLVTRQGRRGWCR